MAPNISGRHESNGKQAPYNVSRIHEWKPRCMPVKQSILPGFFYRYHMALEQSINVRFQIARWYHQHLSFIFSLHLSENAQNVHFREAKFQNFPGDHAPGPSQCTRAFGARYYFYRTNSELLRPGLLLLLSNTQYNDYVSYVYKKMFLFSVEKDAPSV